MLQFMNFMSEYIRITDLFELFVGKNFYLATCFVSLNGNFVFGII